MPPVLQIAANDTVTMPTLPSSAPENRLVWKSVTFERISFEEDIRDVFRAIARANGMQVLFRPDVSGEISLEFRNMDLRAAFRKLVEENGLDYAYDAISNTVTLFKAVSVERREQLIALNHISVDRMRTAAQQLKLGGEIIADPASGIVLVKGTIEDVRRLADLAEKLDRAEAERLKQIIEDRAAETREREADAKRLEALARQRSSESDAAERRAAARERQLTLEARAKEAELRQKAIENILNTEIRIIPLRYANVGPTTQSFQGKQVTIPGVDETLRSLLGIGEKSSAVAGGDEGRGSLINVVREELGLAPPTISIDTRTNSIIVRGSKRAVEQVEDLVKRLDRRLPLVEIEVIIVAAQKGVSAGLGIKYGAEGVKNSRVGFGLNSGIEGDLVPTRNSFDRTPVQTTTTVDEGTTIVTNAEPTNDAGVSTPFSIAPLSPITLLPTGSDATVATFVFRGANISLQAQLQALSRDNKAQTISSPRVITLNNQTAKVTNDRTRFVRTAAGANSAGTLEEIKAGLTLSITPSIIESEVSGDASLIRLVINASNKDVSVSSSGDTAVSGSEIQTQVEIPDGATFMLGGLVEDTRIESKDGIPGLQDIPIIGNLFKSRSSQDDLSEIIFFITPRLLRSEDLYASDIAQRRYMDTQRARLHNMRNDLQVNSQLLTIQSVTLEEDE